MFKMSPEQMGQQEEKWQNSREQEINELEFKAYDQFLDKLDGASEETKTQIGIERSSDYRNLESKFRFAQNDFEKNYGAKSAEQVSELSTFGRWKMFAFNRSRYKDLREMEKAKSQLNTVESNIITFAPELVKGGEAFQKILKSSDASSEISKKGRTILQRGLARDKEIEGLPPSKKIEAQSVEISIIDQTTKKTSSLYESIKKQESKKDPSKVKPGIMDEGDARGQMLAKMGKLDRQRKLAQESMDTSSNLRSQTETRVRNNMQTVNAIKKNSRGLLNFEGQDMWNAYYEKETTRERLINALGFDPTEGSQIKAFINAAFAVGRDGLGIYSQEMKKYNAAQKELTRMENSLQKATDFIKTSENTEAIKLRKRLQDDDRITQESLTNLEAKHRAIYINIQSKAIELSSRNDISVGEAESILSKATGAINGEIQKGPYRSPALTNPIFKFQMKSGNRSSSYTLYEIGSGYLFKLDS